MNRLRAGNRGTVVQFLTGVRDFFLIKSVKTGCVAHHTPFWWVPSAFVLLQEEKNWVLRLTAYLNRVQKLRMSGSVLQLPPCAFMVYTATISLCIRLTVSSNRSGGTVFIIPSLWKLVNTNWRNPNVYMHLTYSRGTRFDPFSLRISSFLEATYVVNYSPLHSKKVYGRM